PAISVEGANAHQRAQGLAKAKAGPLQEAAVQSCGMWQVAYNMRRLGQLRRLTLGRGNHAIRPKRPA
uniref:hypothetical protein n=1 Tax=Paracoccus sp. T5 TaxID=3402161 RepID=UPI003AD8D935